MRHESTAGSGRASICLALLVRDGSGVVERALASVRPVVDCFVVLDSSTAADVNARVRRALGDLAGKVLRSPWSDYGTGRSELVAAARGAADWLLLLDEDMTFDADDGALDAVDQLDAAAARMLVQDGPYHNRVPCLLDSTKDWYYLGSAHERLSCRQVFTAADVGGMRLVRHGDAIPRRDRLSRDLRLLNGDLARDPGNPRALFYIAQTLRDLGEHEEAIEHYRRRLLLGGHVEELFCTHYQIGLLLEAVSPQESADELLAAWEAIPERAEPLYHLARQNRLRGRHRVALSFARQASELALPDDGLFLEPWIYQCGVPFELADAAWRAGEARLALEVSGTLLAAGADRLRLPAEYRSHLELIAGDAAVAP